MPKLVRVPLCLLCIIALLAASMGCIEEGDEWPEEGCNPPPEEEFLLHREECYMSGTDTWNADHVVENTHLEKTFPVEKTVISCPSLSKGDGSEGPAYTMVDADSDGMMTTGDHILFFNLTEDLLIHHNLSCEGEWVTCFAIGWDEEDWTNYLVRASWVNETQGADRTFSATITLWMREGDSGISVDPGWRGPDPDLRLGFLSVHGTVLPGAKMVYNDTDMDRRVSDGDVIELAGLTQDHHRCRVQFIHGNRLMGWTHIFLPGID